jgi:hypothetical protein
MNVIMSCSAELRPAMVRTYCSGPAWEKRCFRAGAVRTCPQTDDVGGGGLAERICVDQIQTVAARPSVEIIFTRSAGEPVCAAAAAQRVVGVLARVERESFRVATQMSAIFRKALLTGGQRIHNYSSLALDMSE